MVTVGHAAVSKASPNKLPVKQKSSTSSTGMKSFDVQGDYLGSEIFESAVRQINGEKKVIRTTTFKEVRYKIGDVNAKLKYYPKSTSTGQPTIKLQTQTVNGKWRSREAYRFKR